MRIIITGASGLLGRAVRKECIGRGDDILALSNTQRGGGLQPLDLTDQAKTDATFRDFAPAVIIHCAAERRPDVAEKDPEGTERLNVSVPGALARLASELKALFIFVSTDYVFDGNAPPQGYSVHDKPNPLNLYGKSKWSGEQAATQAYAQGTVVLRVPVLYGEAPSNKDSAVNILVDAVKAQKEAGMDDWAIRFPTCVEDVARVLRDISARYIETEGPSLPRLLFFSAQTPFTKYSMSLVFARILKVSTDHLMRKSDSPPPGDTSRPRDAHLSNTALEATGISAEEGMSFEAWWARYLDAQ